ncbi:hypothetical protein [Enhygromyxa salina]|uniref:hypothetical protein n=1 Tax=Enhygromyxa salina TaxID=215803 RepID=UPI0011BA968E|nr:hypothetical protein [Enhygromyxa salina]
MKTIIRIMATVLFAGGLLGGCYTGVDRTPIPHVSFDLPEDWKIIHEQPGYIVVLGDSDLGAPVKLEIGPHTITPGNESDARALIVEMHEFAAPKVPVEGWAAHEFTEYTLADGKTIFVHMQPDTYARAHGTAAEDAWGSQVAYEADEHVINLYLSDRADLYLDELNIIVGTSVFSPR